MQTKKQLADLIRSAKAERKQLMSQIAYLDNIIALSGDKIAVEASPQKRSKRSGVTKSKRAWCAAAKRRAKARCNTPEMKQKYSQAQRARRARERLHQSQSSLSI